MAHHLTRQGYSQLVARLNRFPQGAPPSPLLHKILSMLFSREEAGLVADLPIKPFTAALAAKIWNMPLSRAENILDRLALICTPLNGRFGP